MSYLEELLHEFRNGAKIRCSDWLDGVYIQRDGESIVDNKCRTSPIHAEDALSDRWELYKEPEPDWQYIVGHKCLCRFWDNDDSWIIGTLSPIYGRLGQPEQMFYSDSYRGSFKNCRPVNRDEVNFYLGEKER